MINIYNRTNPVSHWLVELRTVYEAECTIMLQSKAVVGEALGKEVTLCNTAQTCQTIRAIQQRAHAVSAIFAKLCRSVSPWICFSRIV